MHWLRTLIAVVCCYLLTPLASAVDQPNILVIWGDDIGFWNLSTNNMGMMGYQTPNIDRIANEGAKFTDYYGQQSCTAGRSAFITGQSPIRTGLTKVGVPGSDMGIQPEDVTLASLLKEQGYATGQFGKNHLGDRDEFLPTEHGFDEFFGNLYHLNAEEEPEDPDYPKSPAFKKMFGPRGVVHSFADGRVTDTGPLNRKRMETVDLEFLEGAQQFINRAAADDVPAAGHGKRIDRSHKVGDSNTAGRNFRSWRRTSRLPQGIRQIPHIGKPGTKPHGIDPIGLFCVQSNGFVN